MTPLSRTMQALVSSISSSAPVLGAIIDSGTDEIGGRGRMMRGAHAKALPTDVRRRLIDTLLPVVERSDADTDLPAELGDAQVRLPLPLELCSPPSDSAGLSANSLETTAPALAPRPPGRNPRDIAVPAFRLYVNVPRKLRPARPLCQRPQLLLQAG